MGIFIKKNKLRQLFFAVHELFPTLKTTEIVLEMISGNWQKINMKPWSMLIGDDSQRFVSDLLLFRVHRTTKMMAIIGIIIYAAAILCRISYGYPNYNKVTVYFRSNYFFSFIAVCCCFLILWMHRINLLT